MPFGIARSSDKNLRFIKYNILDDSNDNKKTKFICDFIDSNIWKSKETQTIINGNSNNINIEYDYIIPKNTKIEPNLSYLLLKDKNNWNLENDPMIPNLNYWLQVDQSSSLKIKFKNNNNSIPFSVGIRDCVGQQLGKSMYIFCNVYFLITLII